MEEIELIIKNMREYYESGVTHSVKFRLKVLKNLRTAIKYNEAKFFKALKMDFNKPNFETYTNELAMIYAELNNVIKHLKKYAKDKRVKTGLTSWPSHGIIKPEPYGVVLVMAPWNYPLNLTIIPLIGALAAGNCVVLKPSNRSPHTTETIKNILELVFDKNLIYVVDGGHETNELLLKEKYDMIFFTGGVKVGKIVAEKAAKDLTPVVLELGGKSPVFVSKHADIPLAAKRIVWGKFLNGGQTCIAPDYFLVDDEVCDKFIEECKKCINKFYYEYDIISLNFPHMINVGHFDKVFKCINYDKVVFGGKVDRDKLCIEPTIMDHVTLDDAVMQEEIFGPIMPIIRVNDSNEAIGISKKVLNGAKPLATYIFTEDKHEASYILDHVSFGGGCINDVIVHVGSENLPFGGIGNSGMGQYHGKKTFDTFTHYKSVCVKHKLDLPFRYPKYTEKKLNFVRKLFK